MDLRLAIKQRAVDIGFDLVGVAPATPGSDLDFVREWLERGYGGEMRYLSNPKRLDPRAVLTSVKSVACVGLIYDTSFPYSTEVHTEGVRSPESGVSSQESEARSQKPEERRQTRVSNFDFPISPPAQPRAWISRYAWGGDYHEIMREKLERLRAAIEELAPGTETRVYVDTGPVIERAFARFSGVGWMGKNTCIINEEKGSWFFLGVILTNLALEVDLPAPDRCGSCRACLDACPTGALVEPYVMDATRCISYLTIELKGSIPRELRPGVGVNIFGCDICQDVCPWNGKDRIQESGVRSQKNDFQPLSLSHHPSAVSSQVSSDGPVSSILNPKSQIQNLPPSPQSPAPNTQNLTPNTFSLFAPPLESLASLTEDDFRKLFAHSPIKRAKYRGWLRNLCVAMGNSGDARLVPKLQELALHADPIVREHAEWALSRFHET